MTDFEIPKKYGSEPDHRGQCQASAASFRALRTIPVMDDFAKDMEQLCPDALFLTYTNR